MENFIIHNPVKLYFGDNALNFLPKEANRLGRKVLLVYGRNSIKTSGLYDKIIQLLKGYEIVEYQGIKSNPIIEDVDNAAKLAAKEHVELIVAVGGGSVIDSAKVISVAQHYDGSAWDIMKRKFEPKKATPLLCVLTLAATGTEMNPFAVVQNHATQEKIGWGSPLTYPIASFLDPSLTATVPADYTAYGLADMIAHVLEAYFGLGDSPLSDEFAFSIIREIMDAGSQLMANLSDYQLRARVMYAGTMALNGLLTQGKKSADWGVHALGHNLSLLYDMPHGASLTIAYPAWLKLQSEKLADRISKLGLGIFGVDDVNSTIHLLEQFFISIGCPITLNDFDINVSEKQKINDLNQTTKASGVVHQLTDNERERVLDLMFLEA